MWEEQIYAVLKSMSRALNHMSKLSSIFPNYTSNVCMQVLNCKHMVRVIKELYMMSGFP